MWQMYIFVDFPGKHYLLVMLASQNMLLMFYILSLQESQFIMRRCDISPIHIPGNIVHITILIFHNFLHNIIEEFEIYN